MAIIKEYYTTREDGVRLYKSYSDKNLYIQQQPTGIEYAEAIDVETAPYTYVETDKPIEEIDNPTEEILKPIEDNEQ